MADLDNQYQDTLMALGRIFRAARDANERDQESIERAVGVSRGLISRLENGTGTLPSLETAIRIARELEADEGLVTELTIRAQIIRLLKKNDTSLLDAEAVVAASIDIAKSLGVKPATLMKLARRKG